MAASKEELKSLLMKMKEESEKAGSKLNIPKSEIWYHHFMANRRRVEAVTDFIFLGSNTVMRLKDACSLEGKL